MRMLSHRARYLRVGSGTGQATDSEMHSEAESCREDDYREHEYDVEDVEGGVAYDEAYEDCQRGGCSSDGSGPAAHYFHQHNLYGLILTICLALTYLRAFFVDFVVTCRASSTDSDTMCLRVFLNFRYLGTACYFILAGAWPNYLLRWRNAEAPLLVSAVMQIYHHLLDGTAVAPLLGMLVLTVLALLRHMPLLRIFINPYSAYNLDFRTVYKRDLAMVRGWFSI